VTFRLAHLSDSHIGPLPKPHWRELMSKRLTGYVNWQRRGRIHNMDVLEAIVADLRAQSPDHIAMTGDILNIGLPAEFAMAADWLRTLGTPQDVSFVPGNHDAYVPSAMPFIAKTFAPWMAGDEMRADTFPYLRRRGEIAIIGLTSGVPTAPLLANGRLGGAQRARFAQMLSETRGLMRLVMIHHPPHNTGATPGRGLTDSRRFEKIIREEGAELILHGHNHRHSIAYLEGPHGRVPVVGVASASAVPGTERHRAAWQMYEITRAGARWRIEGVIRGMKLDSSGVMEVGRFALGDD
jgi:3',5'-cyclic AMP phosphodiesterase CpdA